VQTGIVGEFALACSQYPSFARSDRIFAADPQVYKSGFDPTVNVGLRHSFIGGHDRRRPKREPRPGAELAGIAKSPASAFYEDTDDDQGPEDYQRKGGLGSSSPSSSAMSAKPAR
jgi:hypothetical protein